VTRTLLSLLLLLPICGYVAWRLGGPAEVRGMGVVVGYVVGAAVSLWGIAYQRHTLKHRPEKAATASVIDFGVKLLVVLAGAMALTGIPELAELCDWRTFLLTFASISLVVLTFGTFDAVRVLGTSTSATQAPAHKPAK